MISQSKFSKLREITKYFKLAEELKKLRNEYLKGSSYEIEDLGLYRNYISSEPQQLYLTELDDILNETDLKARFEKIYFLYLRIKSDFGYPAVESDFIKSSGDSESQKMRSTELIVILENLRSAFNVGSIIRSCECFGVKELILFGITPGPENARTLKTAKGAENGLKISRSEILEVTIKGLKEKGYRIAGAETGKGSTDLKSYSFMPKTALIFGNEEIGITERTLKLCDDIVSIEMRGRKNSLNAANAASIFLYEYSRKI